MTMEPVGYNHRLRGYTQSWKYFKPCQGAVAEAILFKEDTVLKAEDVVRSLRRTFPHKTLVDVHVAWRITPAGGQSPKVKPWHLATTTPEL